MRTLDGEETIAFRSIGVMDADGRNAREVTPKRRLRLHEDIDPTWSPDGRRIAFIRENITAAARGGAALFTVRVDGSGLRRLTAWELRAANPDWSPDGREISFRSEQPGPTEFVGEIYTVHPDGTGLRRLTDPGEYDQVLASSFSPDSEWIAFAATGVDGQPDISTMRRDGSDVAPLTRTPEWDSGPDWGAR